MTIKPKKGETWAALDVDAQNVEVVGTPGGMVEFVELDSGVEGCLPERTFRGRYEPFCAMIGSGPKAPSSVDAVLSQLPGASGGSDYHAKKFDAGKSRPDLIPGEALLAIGRVLEFGARKYSENSWRDVPDAEKRYTAAAARHFAAILAGEEIDPESGLPHWDHLGTNVSFVIALRAGKKAA